MGASGDISVWLTLYKLRSVLQESDQLFQQELNWVEMGPLALSLVVSDRLKL